MNLEPLNRNVLVEKREKEEKTVSGIILPDSMKNERPPEGKVVAIASDLESKVKVGDTVLFGKYSGHEVQIDGKDYLLMKEDDLLGIMKK